MDKLFSQIADILTLDPGQRGLLGNVSTPDFAQLTQILSQAENTLIVTGFPITGMDIGETDGPIGAAAIALAFKACGKNAAIVTDSLSLELTTACVDGEIDVHEIGLKSGEHDCRSLVEELRPDLIIAIERPGKGRDGHFHNMRGEIIDDMVADSDMLMELDIPTIAIGDGGNELGMGNFYSVIAENVPNGGLTAAVAKSTVPLVAGVSNWWGWAIAAILGAIYKTQTMQSAEQEHAMLSRLVEAGGVDGVLKQKINSVDGMMHGGIDEVHAKISAALGAYLNHY